MRLWQIILALVLASTATAASAWWQQDWSYRKPVTVDLTSSGVNITGPVGRVPVLVRLHGGNFTFSEALPNGTDLRFIADDDKTPLTYHIESYDPQGGIATVWVDVPNVAGGTKAKLWLYYGNKSAKPTVDTKASFDADYVLVYHFIDAAAAPTRDATAYGNNAANAPPGLNPSAIVGAGARFNGAAGLTVPASPSLATAAAGSLTLGAWVKQDAAAADGSVIERLGAAGSIRLGIAQGVPYAEVRGGSAARIMAPAAIAAGQWTHLAVTADGKTITLYVNGKSVATGAAVLPALDGATMIGGVADAPFTGDLDEVRVSKIARSADLIAVDAAAQGPDSKLLAFGDDEEQGVGGGVLGYILGHISGLDGFIIGLCVLLLAVALLVMFFKARYIAVVDTANQVFLRRYGRVDGDLVSLNAMELTPAERSAMPRSPLARIYESGIDQVEARNKLYGNRALSSQTVEAIRSELDAQQVFENQKFDRLMVLLTIAISGGPFIGLLGTVIGVMTTFGGVAIAGDVNVNAIAPGIAAALMATIAGLSAAIPSLFGYNYLNSRISTISDEMRVFVDRLVTRLAETQAHRAAPPPVALAAE